MDTLARIDLIAEISSKIRDLVPQEQQAEAASDWTLANRLQAEIRKLDDHRTAAIRG